MDHIIVIFMRLCTTIYVSNIEVFSRVLIRFPPYTYNLRQDSVKLCEYKQQGISLRV